MTTRRAHARPSLRISRVIAASRERVFRAWITPVDVERWFGRPEGVELKADIDLRVGGGYRYSMQPEGEGPTFPLSGTFIEIEPPERLVYSFRWEREVPLPGGDYTGETLVTVEFHEAGEATEIVLTHEGFPNDEVSGFHEAGWGLSLDRLAALCESPSG